MKLEKFGNLEFGMVNIFWEFGNSGEFGTVNRDTGNTGRLTFFVMSV